MAQDDEDRGGGGEMMERRKVWSLIHNLEREGGSDGIA